MLRSTIFFCTFLTFMYSYSALAMDPEAELFSTQQDAAKAKKAKPAKKRIASKVESSSSGSNSDSEASARKKAKKKAVIRATEDEVELREGRGGRDTGGGEGGHHWGVFWNDKRAGKVYINLIESELLGQHASLQIYLNKKSQGKGIGSIAYRMACEMSRYDTIYAYTAKKNIASRRAAIAAGFERIMVDAVPQILMQWDRKKKQ